ncbi:MAG: 2'-5' RNA ligase family protein [bacterium]
MRYLVAIPLPESEAGPFIDLRDSYRHYAPRWKLTLGPHITIHRPQESLLPIGKAIELFSSSPVCQGFSMPFNKIDAFIGKRNSAIYFEPDNYVPFCDIRKSYQSVAEQILNNTAEEWDFHPHLTLINRLSSDAAQLVLKELRSRPVHFTYNLGRVCLYKKETEDDSWQEIAQNKLS